MEITELFRSILEKAKSRTESWNGKFYFVYLTERIRYRDNPDHIAHRKRGQILSLLQDLDIPVIDIHDKVFSKHPDPLSLFSFRVSTHYNTAGYLLTAKAIKEKLLTDGFL